MADCRVCGGWFSSSNPKTELCSTCERALKRLNGYAVTVVRCKDCINGQVRPYSDFIHCKVMGCNVFKPDDFCSYGKQKEQKTSPGSTGIQELTNEIKRGVENYGQEADF